MKILNYIDTTSKGDISRNFTKQIKCDYSNTSKLLPSGYDLVIIHGVLRGMDKVVQDCINKNQRYIMIDNGYYGKKKRAAVNATVPSSFRPGKRYEHNVKLEKWKGGQGKHILVIPPSYPYMNTFKCHEFLNYVTHNIALYTDRDIVIRPKPAFGKKAKPLEKQLKDAYAVVSWGSAVCLEAVRLGIPTMSLGWCPAAMVSYNLENLETKHIATEKNRMSVFDNMTHYCFDLNEIDRMYNYILDNDKYNSIEFFDWRELCQQKQ
jgi:hypothetical protein